MLIGCGGFSLAGMSRIGASGDDSSEADVEGQPHTAVIKCRATQPLDHRLPNPTPPQGGVRSKKGEVRSGLNQFFGKYLTSLRSSPPCSGYGRATRSGDRSNS